MRLFENLNVDFTGKRRVGYMISGTLLVLSVLSLFTRGIEFGIDFSGGMEFVIEGTGDYAATAVRDDLSGPLGSTPEVKTFGDSALLIRTLGGADLNSVQETIVNTMQMNRPDLTLDVVKRDTVSARFAEDLLWGALQAVIGSLIVIFIYILVRFSNWKYSLGAVAALFHDVTIVLGLFSLLHGWLPFSLQLDQAIIAAFLTIVGYSLNDTVVIFDRIRENLNISKTANLTAVINQSINQTISRTVITSGTTLLVVLTLFIFGGEVLRGFTFALIVGIIVGTYSSIYVASPVVIELSQRKA
jgi:preprotein translocase SecF subunit